MTTPEALKAIKDTIAALGSMNEDQLFQLWEAADDLKFAVGQELSKRDTAEVS